MRQLTGENAENLSEYPDQPVYNTKAVSVRTGVPADTFRAWERRYGVPKPYRTDESHRLYSERDVASINWLKRQTETGLTIRQAVALLRKTMSPPAVPPLRETGSPEEAARLLFSALIGLDTPQAERVLSNCLSRYGVEAACVSVIQPVMYRIGREWSEGALPISVEHFASYVMRSRLTALIDSHGHTGTLGPAMTACAPGETHELGLLMLNLCLLRRDVRVVHLGADLPLGELVEMARRVRPRVICLSASTEENARTLIESVRSLGEMGDELPRVSCGGYAFRANPELRSRVESLWLGGDAVQAADAIHALLIEQ